MVEVIVYKNNVCFLYYNNVIVLYYKIIMFGGFAVSFNICMPVFNNMCL